LAAGGDGGAAVAAGAEPAGRTAVAAGESVSAVADQAAVAAVARTAEAGAFVSGVGVAVTEQDARVRVIGGAGTDEEPNDTARLPRC
jgi:hypothetical protein